MGVLKRMKPGRTIGIGKSPMSAHPTKYGALTLVEALVIIIVLGIAGAIVVPRLSEAKSDIRSSSLKTSLKTIQAQISLYQIQHKNRLPTVEKLAEQLTVATDADGNAAPPGTPGYPFGPYLQSVPVNPYTRNSSVGAGPPGTSDWFYDSTTGQFLPNDSLERRELYD